MKRLLSALLMVSLIAAVTTNAFSRDEHYRFHEGRYYRHAGWWGLGGFITGLAVGASVASLPPRYETVVVGGVPYYYYDGYYYQAAPGGYVVVAPPAVAGVPADAAGGYSPLVYIVGTLVVIFLIAALILVLKKLFT